jgi:hypothetical protein
MNLGALTRANAVVRRFFEIHLSFDRNRVLTASIFPLSEGRRQLLREMNQVALNETHALI